MRKNANLIEWRENAGYACKGRGSIKQRLVIKKLEGIARNKTNFFLYIIC